jgi:hypothetical protein
MYRIEACAAAACVAKIDESHRLLTPGEPHSWRRVGFVGKRVEKHADYSHAEAGPNCYCRRSRPAHHDRIEKTAGAVTWAADEHVLCGLALAWWLWCRGGLATQRQASDHLLLTVLTKSALPHLLRIVFNQRRPDRGTIIAFLG